MSEPPITLAEIRAVAQALSVDCPRCGGSSMLRFRVGRGLAVKRAAAYRVRQWEVGVDNVRLAPAWPDERGLPCPACGLELRLVSDPPPPRPVTALQPVEEWEEELRGQWLQPIEPEHQAEADSISRAVRWVLEHRPSR